MLYYLTSSDNGHVQLVKCPEVLLTTHVQMEQTDCSKTSAHKLKTPVNQPEESIQHSEHGDSLQSRTYNHFMHKCFAVKQFVPPVLNRGCCVIL
jgi:hypothetical protein